MSNTERVGDETVSSGNLNIAALFLNSRIDANEHAEAHTRNKLHAAQVEDPSLLASLHAVLEYREQVVRLHGVESPDQTENDDVFMICEFFFGPIKHGETLPFIELADMPCTNDDMCVFRQPTILIGRSGGHKIRSRSDQGRAGGS